MGRKTSFPYRVLKEELASWDPYRRGLFPSKREHFDDLANMVSGTQQRIGLSRPFPCFRVYVHSNALDDDGKDKEYGRKSKNDERIIQYVIKNGSKYFSPI